MKILKNKCISITANKSGKGEPFHFKPVWCPHWHSLSQIDWFKDSTYKCYNLYVPMKIQIFWLWFFIEINLIAEKVSEMKVVNYEATHYAMLDKELGSS